MSELSVRQYLHNDGSGLTWGYDKSDVDAAIAELKEENSKLKRALWLARAWGANQRTKYLDLFLTGRAHALRKYKWIKITSKCRAKAEEYK